MYRELQVDLPGAFDIYSVMPCVLEYVDESNSPRSVHYPGSWIALYCLAAPCDTRIAALTEGFVRRLRNQHKRWSASSNSFSIKKRGLLTCSQLGPLRNGSVAIWTSVVS